MNKLINFSDLTFLIPFRQDSIDRLINLRTTAEFILKHFDTNIYILEADSYNSELIGSIVSKKVEHTFVEDFDPIFFRTRYINQMVQNCETPFLSVWDTDIIISPKQIIQSVEWLRNGEADFVYPYEKHFLDTSPILRKLFLETGNIEVLEQNTKKMKEMYTPNPIGGAFFANVKAYKESGLENEDFYGWGMEDGERYYRWENRGYKIKRVPGPLFHLTHGRGINSVFHNADQQFFKHKEVLTVRRNRMDVSSHLTIKNGTIAEL